MENDFDPESPEEKYIDSLCSYEAEKIFTYLVKKYSGTNLTRIKIITGTLVIALQGLLKNYIPKECHKDFIDSLHDIEDENSSTDAS